MRWVVGTDHGLVDSDGHGWLGDRSVVGVVPDGRAWLSLVDGHEVVRVHGDEVDSLGVVDEEVGRCLLPVDGGVLVGTAHARLSFVRDGKAELLSSFDGVEGRDRWYTPWGGPPDTRSLTASPDGVLFANVHVGGILRAERPDGVWSPTIDIDADVHQVLADPLDASHVVAAAALGLAESHNGGETWTFVTDGLHARYARAVAVDGDTLFLSASTGPRGGRAAVYRRDRAGEAFAKCERGLPEWFDGNVDSHCLAAGGGTVLFGTEDGRAFLSEDRGERWREVVSGSADVHCVAIAAE